MWNLTCLGFWKLRCVSFGFSLTEKKYFEYEAALLHLIIYCLKTLSCTYVLKADLTPSYMYTRTRNCLTTGEIWLEKLCLSNPLP